MIKSIHVSTLILQHVQALSSSLLALAATVTRGVSAIRANLDASTALFAIIPGRHALLLLSRTGLVPSCTHQIVSMGHETASTLATDTLFIHLGSLLRRAVSRTTRRVMLVIIIVMLSSASSAITRCLRLALLAVPRVFIVVIDEVGGLQLRTPCWAFNLMFSVLVKPALAFVDLVLHELVDPEAHLDIVLQHHDDHTVQGEAQVIFLDRKMLQFFLQHAQLPITFSYDLE